MERHNRSRLKIGSWFSGLRTSAGLALLGLLLLTLGSQLWRPTYVIQLGLDLAVNTSADGGQLFIQTRGGYSEEHSIPVQLIPDGNRHTYVANIRGDIWARHLRFDPGSAPGKVSLYGIKLSSENASISYTAPELVNRLKRLNQLTEPSVGGVAESMSSLGNDPQFELKIPFKIYRVLLLKLALGIALSLIGGVVIILYLRIRKKEAEQKNKGLCNDQFVLVPLTFLAAHVALTAFGAGCDELGCSVRGLRYGSQIFLAGILCACLGAAFLRAISGRANGQKPGFFFSLVVGQALFIVYVYLRSAQSFYFFNLPITVVDCVIIATISVIFLLWQLYRSPDKGTFKPVFKWLWVELALFAALSMVVADRELPRLVMLSTDPDIHAFFAKQIERFGSIPRTQGHWGSGSFDYPAGSPALIYIWAKLSGLNIRNSLAALVLLQTFFAATLVGESVIAKRSGEVLHYIVVQTALLAVLAAGLLIPFYNPFSHMEGVGRQLAFAFTVAVVIASANSGSLENGTRKLSYWVMLLLLFVLAVLNPVTVIFPVFLIAAIALYTMLRDRAVPWRVLVPASFVLLIFLDPYFLSMFTGSSHGIAIDKLDLSADLVVKSGAQIAADWFSSYVTPANWSWRPIFAFLPWQPYPAFGLIIGLLVLICYLTHERERRASKPIIAAAAVLTICFLLSLGLFLALENDRRYYLLYPYFVMGLAHYKIWIVLSIIAVMLLSYMTRGLSKAKAVSISLALACFIGLIMRAVQPMQFEPRVNFCEEGRCIAADDWAVLERIQWMMGSSEFREAKSNGERILVPNAVVQMGGERWAFPVGSGRVLPFMDTLPVAFFYLQADPAFTTDSYVQKVCETFDRDWLLGHKIDYVLVPSQRNGACVAGLNSLVQTDRIVVKVGNSYLIKLLSPKL